MIDRETLKAVAIFILFYILLTILLIFFKQFSRDSYSLSLGLINDALERAGFIISGFYLIASKIDFERMQSIFYAKFIKLSGLVGFSTVLALWVYRIFSLDLLLNSGLGGNYIFKIWISLFVLLFIITVFVFLYKYLERKDSRLNYWAVVAIVIFTIASYFFNNVAFWFEWILHLVDPIRNPITIFKNYPPNALIIMTFLIISVIYSVRKTLVNKDPGKQTETIIAPNQNISAPPNPVETSPPQIPPEPIKSN